MNISFCDFVILCFFKHTKITKLHFAHTFSYLNEKVLRFLWRCENTLP